MTLDRHSIFQDLIEIFMKLREITDEELLRLYAAGDRDFEAIRLRCDDLNGANLSGINSCGSDLGYGLLNNINFSRSFFRGACFHGELNGANFSHASLEGAFFESAFLVGANFSYANLRGVYLPEASLDNTLFIEADLSGACLAQVILDDADLSNAKFCGALLSEAGMARANLSNANFSGARGFFPESSCIFSNTIMPDGSIRNG
jgi:uncharacterized protein YjbI with pentapeptide repeats